MRKFRGGVHPHGEKASGATAIENAAIPPKVIIPLQQHTGAPAQPIVEVGAEVKKGQKIGEAGGFVSAMVHASISGKVAAISDYLYPNPLGRKVPSVVIESDGKDEWSEDIKPRKIPPAPFTKGGGEGFFTKGEKKDLDSKGEHDPRVRGELDSLDNKEILGMIREAGIVGLGGAAFPAHVKLSIPEGKKIDTVILNGVECEPYMTPDHRLMLEEPGKIIDGMKIIMRVTSVKRGFIGIERNKPDAIEVMKEAVKKEPQIPPAPFAKGGAAIEVVPLKVKYPQGWEGALIKAILGKEVPSGGLPLDVGVVVSNIGTATAISDAVRLGRPLIERVISVTGPGVAQPKNLRVRIGTPFSDLIAQCGGFNGTARKVISGGPMMGFAVFDMNVPVVKGTTNILVFADKDVKIQASRSCIRCGRCVSVCPVGLMPTMIASLSDKGKFEEAEKYFPLDCKECGCCAYACPAKIPLVQLIQFAKSDIMARRRAAQAK